MQCRAIGLSTSLASVGATLLVLRVELTLTDSNWTIESSRAHGVDLLRKCCNILLLPVGPSHTGMFLPSQEALSGSPHLSLRVIEQPSHRLLSMDINHRPYTLQTCQASNGVFVWSADFQVPPPDIPSIHPLIARSPAHITGRDQSGPEEAK
ncbi:hypothetical protein BGY98DRAFT_969606 [Russula aff. rugulosa BPL654]|nr:hypothetical protein BGY98DRAFT_969606 [Russula aff. rugulosa BPL654]